MYGGGATTFGLVATSILEFVALVVAAGATVKPEWLADQEVRADPMMLAALCAEMPFK